MAYCSHLFLAFTLAAQCVVAPAFAAYSSFGTQSHAITVSSVKDENSPLSHVLPCLKIEEIKNSYTPADLLKASVLCFSGNRNQDGADLYSAAGTYGYFDMLRVSDATAHATVKMLMASNLAALSPDKKDYLPYYFMPLKNPLSEESRHICKGMKKTGAPNYYPDYMIKRGRLALAHDTKPAIVAHFDARKSWADTLKNYLHCSH